MSKDNMPSEEAILDAVMKSPFATMEDAELHRFLNLCTFKTYNNGDCVRNPDEPDRALQMVISGAVTIYDVSKTRIMAQFEIGDCLGMMSLIFPIHKVPLAFATGENNVILSFSEENFRKIGEIDPKLAMSVMRCVLDCMTPYVEAVSEALAEI